MAKLFTRILFLYLGLARWTTLGDWNLGEAYLDALLNDQVPQEGALAGSSLVSLGNLKYFFFVQVQ